MHTIVPIACLLATPVSPALAAESAIPSLVAEDPVDSELEWIERLILYLQWLCEIFGNDFCNSEAGLIADPHMITFVVTYSEKGVPDDLDDVERFRAQTIVADLYSHLKTPKSGTPSVADAMAEALIAAYQDLGGDPADL